MNLSKPLLFKNNIQGSLGYGTYAPLLKQIQGCLGHHLLILPLSTRQNQVSVTYLFPPGVSAIYKSSKWHFLIPPGSAIYESSKWHLPMPTGSKCHLQIKQMALTYGHFHTKNCQIKN